MMNGLLTDMKKLTKNQKEWIIRLETFGNFCDGVNMREWEDIHEILKQRNTHYTRTDAKVINIVREVYLEWLETPDKFVIIENERWVAEMNNFLEMYKEWINK